MKQILFSIIPPMLVVLSLAGIIIFLMKKASAVALLGDDKETLSDREREDRELAARYAALKKENRKTPKEVAGVVFSKTGEKARARFSRIFWTQAPALGEGSGLVPRGRSMIGVRLKKPVGNSSRRRRRPSFSREMKRARSK